MRVPGFELPLWSNFTQYQVQPAFLGEMPSSRSVCYSQWLEVQVQIMLSNFLVSLQEPMKMCISIFCSIYSVIINTKRNTVASVGCELTKLKKELNPKKIYF